VRSPTTRRLLALLAAVWTGGYLGLYLNSTSSQGLEPATWYVALLVTGLGLSVAVASQPARTWGLLGALVVLGLATVAGLLTIGALLLSAVALTLAALVLTPAGEPG
jgi:hypothetical protein